MYKNVGHQQKCNQKLKLKKKIEILTRLCCILLFSDPTHNPLTPQKHIAGTVLSQKERKKKKTKRCWRTYRKSESTFLLCSPRWWRLEEHVGKNLFRIRHLRQHSILMSITGLWAGDFLWANSQFERQPSYLMESSWPNCFSRHD